MENASMGHMGNLIGDQRVCNSGTFYAWFVDILTGLKHAHEKAGFVHYDLKPPNLLISNGDDNQLYCRIADLGLAVDILTHASSHDQQ